MGCWKWSRQKSCHIPSAGDRQGAYADRIFRIIMDRLYQIMERLDRIEGNIALATDPSKSYSITEKARIMKEALATRDKKKIKEAQRIINGK